MKQIESSDTATHITATLFLIFTAWWGVLQILGSPGDHASYVFGAFYGSFLSLFGGYVGLRSAVLWGGWKSLMGKVVILLSWGLLAQAFGQIANSIYNLLLGIEVSYPGIPDIGFFGSIPLYIFAVYLLIEATGGKIKLRSLSAQMIALCLPIAGLIISYVIFLQQYTVDWSTPLVVLLDFGYPLGQALYVTLAFLAYSLSRGMLGGVMKKPILLLLAALVMQYFSDFAFLYANSHDGYFVGGVVDFIYLIAYTLMTLGLISLERVGTQLRRLGEKG